MTQVKKPMQIWNGSSIFGGMGGYDLVLMLRLATWLMRPRSMLTGHWAAGHRGQSWKVGKWLRLHSCDWLEPRGQPPMISHIPAVLQRSDPTMKER